MNKLYTFCLFIGICFCAEAQHNIQFEIKKISEFNSSFHVEQQGETLLWDRHFALIEFSFHSTFFTQLLLFDYLVFCIPCVQNTVLLKKPYPLPPYKNLLTLKDSLSKSELIIENKQGQFRIFNLPRNIDGMFVSLKTRFYSCDNVYIEDPCEEIYELTGEKPVKFKVDILVNDLKIQDTNEEIRLHYVFKPTERQQKLGFTQSFILTSNWISLTDKE